MIAYLANVKKYDVNAKKKRRRARSSSISVSRCATAAHRRLPTPTSKELDRVKAGWITKKMNVDYTKMVDNALKKVYNTMPVDNTKSLVTFYYLVSKNLAELGTF